MKQDARGLKQEAKSKMQETRESLAFLQAFIAETQPVLNDVAQDQASLAQIMERASDPGADLSKDVLQRIITRVREACLA
jgi:hypothetical protein